MNLELGKNLLIRRVYDLSEEEANQWDRLFLTEDLRRAFMSRQYARIVSDGGQDVVVLIIYGAGEPAAFLPLQRLPGLRGRSGVFESVGGVMTDYFGVVAKAGFRIDAKQLLDATAGTVNAIFFTHLSESQKQFGLSSREGRIGLRTRLDGSFLDYWAERRKLKKDFVKDTERKESHLEQEVGNVNFEWTSSQPEHDLKWLVTMKENQYKRTGKCQAPLFDKKNVALLHALVNSKNINCQGVLSSLRSGDRLIAAHLGLRCHNMLHVWFPVYDHDFARYSPGRILNRKIIEHGKANGVDVFDRGEGDTPAKREFANEEHLLYRGLWHASGWRGLRARVVLSAFWRISRWLG